MGDIFAELFEIFHIILHLKDTGHLSHDAYRIIIQGGDHHLLRSLSQPGMITQSLGNYMAGIFQGNKVQPFFRSRILLLDQLLVAIINVHLVLKQGMNTGPCQSAVLNTDKR